MKYSVLFQSYLWLTHTIYQTGKISLKEINKKWQQNEISGGMPLVRSTFIRYKQAIEELFGIVVDCERKNGYRYYIDNPEILSTHPYYAELLAHFSITSNYGMRWDGLAKIYAEPFCLASHQLDHLIRSLYHRFVIELSYSSKQGYIQYFTVKPLFLYQCFGQWYLVAFLQESILEDRKPVWFDVRKIQRVRESQHFFTCSPEVIYQIRKQGKFHEPNEVELAPILIKMKVADSLRTQWRQYPINSTQVELQQESTYSIFQVEVVPNQDFLHMLLSKGTQVELLEPMTLRKQFAQIIYKMNALYL